MTERDYDESNLEQRLRDHYRRRYARSLDPTLIWERVQPYLDQQPDTPSEPVRREKWLAGLPGFLAFRRKGAFMHEREEGLVKSAYEEHTSEAPIRDPSSALSRGIFRTWISEIKFLNDWHVGTEQGVLK